MLASKHVYDNRIKYFASTSYAPSDAAPTTTTQRLAINMIAGQQYTRRSLPFRPHLIQHRLHAYLACSPPAWEHPPGLFSSSMGTPTWPVMPLGMGPNPLTLYGSLLPSAEDPPSLRFLLPSRIWAIKPGPGSLLRPCLTEIQRPQASLLD